MVCGGVDPWVTPLSAGVTVKNGTPNGHWGFWKRMCTKLESGLVTIYGVWWGGPMGHPTFGGCNGQKWDAQWTLGLLEKNVHKT